MILDGYRPRAERFLRPWVRSLRRGGTSVRQVALFGAGVSVGWGALTAFVAGVDGSLGWVLVLLPLALLVRAGSEIAAAMLAAEETDGRGRDGVLRTTASLVSDAAIYLPIGFALPVGGWLVVPVVLVGMLCEMLVALAAGAGLPARRDGPFGAAERGLFLAVVAVLLGIGLTRPETWAPAALAIGTVLALVTFWNRATATLTPDRDAPAPETAVPQPAAGPDRPAH